MIRVDLLGPVDVSVDGRDVPLRPIARAMLARLALAPGRIVGLDQLADDLWAGDGPAHPVNALRVVASRARHQLGADSAALRSTHGGYRLDASVDAAAFGALVRSGRDALAAGRHRDAAVTLRRALAIWRGPPLADVGAAPFTGGHAIRLETERAGALERRLAADLACGRHGEVLSELDALVVEHPFDEQLCGHRMLALYRAGRQADALGAYRTIRQRLVGALGIEPGAALRRLEEAILLQKPELDGPARVDCGWLPRPRRPVHSQGLAVLVATLDRYPLVSVGGPGDGGSSRAVGAAGWSA